MSSRDHAQAAGSSRGGTAQHTPGPWFAIKSSSDWWAISAEDSDLAPVIANTWHTDPNQVANARLIAGAPDLLAAARATVAELSELPKLLERNDALWGAYSQLVAAIVKATGAPATPEPHEPAEKATS